MTGQNKITKIAGLSKITHHLNASFFQLGGGPSKLVMIVGVVLLIAIIGIAIHHHRRSRIKYPVYFHPQPHLGTAAIERPGSDISINPAPYSFTWHVFIYVPDYKYRYGLEKLVFSKGVGEEACPSLHLAGKLNDLIIRVKTTGGKEKLIVRDVNIRKWFHVAIVVQDLRMESYVDGKLRNTLVLQNVIQTNNDNVFVGLDDGFEGYIYRLSYTNKVLSPPEIRHQAAHQPPTRSLSKLHTEY